MRYLLKHRVSWRNIKITEPGRAAHIFDVEGPRRRWTHLLIKICNGRSKKVFMEKASRFLFTIPHLHLQTTTRDPSEGQCHRHKKGEKGKFKYEKICVALKFMVDVVCMCLFLIRDGHMNPRKEYWVDIFHFRSKEKEGSGLRKLFFYVFIDFPSKDVKVQRLTRPPHRPSLPSHFIAFHEIIFPWIFLLFIFIKFCDGRQRRTAARFSGTNMMETSSRESNRETKSSSHIVYRDSFSGCQKFISSVTVWVAPLGGSSGCNNSTRILSD